ncbi:PRC-barrel domain-containing protein [Tranquillimonas alkanivorans]|uniref:PRC-barrel domain-containing protein n=2 Tax=Tranquillimonas alkanivorans TaxID=441119 RepID=A0A1I5Q116_9RHOB|nr:PRC-barrel domain-containing protein [Tranquillimonas alkanivorans]
MSAATPTAGAPRGLATIPTSFQERTQGMKYLTIAAAATLVLSFPALAQDERSGPFLDLRPDGQPVLFASEMIGTMLFAVPPRLEPGEARSSEAELERVGEVSDVMLSPDGEVRALIVSVGGVLGLGDRDIAVALRDVTVRRDRDSPEELQLVIAASADEVDAAPAFERPAQDAAANGGPPGTREAEPAEDMAATRERAEKSAGAVDLPDESPSTEAGEPMAGQAPSGPGAPPAVEREGYRTVDLSAITVTDLDGATVFDPQDEEVGQIERLLMDDQGRIDEVLIDVGDVLGLEEKRVAVALDALTILQSDDEERVRIYMNAGLEELERLPARQ